MAQVSKLELGKIIAARMEELFELVRDEIKDSGAGMIAAGAVLTGGSAQLAGLKTLVGDVLKMPVRVAQPEHLSGLTDQLMSPSFSTSVGLLRLGLIMDQEDARRGSMMDYEDGGRGSKGWRDTPVARRLNDWFRRLLPEDNN